MEESHGGKFYLRRPNGVNKMISWGMRIYFYHYLIGIWNFRELLLVHCMVSVHSPYLWANFEGVGFLSKSVDGESIQTYNGRLIKEFYIRVEVLYIQILIYLPILSFFLLHFLTFTLMVHLLEWFLRLVKDSWCPRFDTWFMAL